MKVLFIGDIVGRIGRQATVKILPELKKEFQPDFIVANAENIAHGSGVTKKTLQPLIEAGIDFFTTGNHAFSKAEAIEIYDQKPTIMIRPENFGNGQVAGKGFATVEVGSKKVLAINLIGQVFMKEGHSNPFLAFDQIMKKIKPEDYAAIIVDFHTEATSEQRAMSWYIDGRASLLVGTHTHVPTADQQIMPAGMAYLTDVGMVGAYESVIGNTKDDVVASFLNDTNHKIDIPESGLVEFSSVLVDIDPKTRKATSIIRVDRKV